MGRDLAGYYGILIKHQFGVSNNRLSRYSRSNFRNTFDVSLDSDLDLRIGSMGFRRGL